MLFTSVEFLAFLALTLILYYVVPRRFQWLLLLAASVVFYALASPWYLIFIAVTIVTTWFSARKISTNLINAKARLSELPKEEKKAFREGEKRRRRRWLVFCLVLNVGILCVVKYTAFALENVNALFAAFGSAMRVSSVNMIVPMAISFYTFQTMGYLIDVYWGKYPAEENVLRFALFASFFPQMVQGPISRFGELSKTLFERHDPDWRGIGSGLIRILWGYFKKLIVADRILAAVSALTADGTFQGQYVVVAVVFYAIQIYADFTGGIDITIGAAEAMGIRLAENFDRPFLSKSIAEYWRRWHITMGTWFRDYVFYPLSTSSWVRSISKWGVKRFGKTAGVRVSVYITTLLLWFLTGLWHGAAWNFIVWGLLNGVAIMIAQECQPLFDRFHERCPGARGNFWYGLFQIVRTFAIVSVFRILDCYQNVPLTFRQIGTIFSKPNFGVYFDGSLLTLGLSGADYIILAISVALMTAQSLMGGEKRDFREKLLNKPPFVRYAVPAALIAIILIFGAYGSGYDATQFIYNRF